MYVDRNISPVDSISLKDKPGRDARFSESFRDIFQRSLNNKSNPRPPKLELTGLLMPCYQELGSRVFRFKLGTESNEYLLSMNNNLAQVAKNAAWEEVTIRGHFDLENSVFDVEKLTLNQAVEPVPIPPSSKDPFEIDAYERIIHQRGKLEPADEYLAS